MKTAQSRFIKSPTGRGPADSIDLQRMFGVRQGHWPAQGCPARCIDGIWVHVLPRDHVSLKPGRRQHRAIATCPECGAQVPAGRLQQHRCDARTTVAEALRRHEFQQTLVRTRAAAADAQRRFDDEQREFPEGRIDSQPLTELDNQ